MVPKENSLKKKITEANFSNLVSYLLYAYQKKSTEKLLAKSILWAKLDMRILQRVALNCVYGCSWEPWPSGRARDSTCSLWFRRRKTITFVARWYDTAVIHP